MTPSIYPWAVGAVAHLAFLVYVFHDWRRRFGANPPLGAYIIPLVMAPAFAAIAYGIHTGFIK